MTERKRRLGIAVCLLLLLPVSMLSFGISFSYMWEWFVAEGFESVGSITIVQAIGIGLMKNVLFLSQNEEVPEDPDMSYVKNNIGRHVIGPFFLLGLAYIVTLFMA